MHLKYSIIVDKWASLWWDMWEWSKLWWDYIKRWGRWSLGNSWRFSKRHDNWDIRCGGDTCEEVQELRDLGWWCNFRDGRCVIRRFLGTRTGTGWHWWVNRVHVFNQNPWKCGRDLNAVSEPGAPLISLRNLVGKPRTPLIINHPRPAIPVNLHQQPPTVPLHYWLPNSRAFIKQTQSSQ